MTSGEAGEPGRASSRSALIVAALDEFSEKGYEAATVAGIAERAGVTTGALYAHFDGKLDLLLGGVILFTRLRQQQPLLAELERSDALEERLPETGASNRHRLADRLHLRGQRPVRLREFLELHRGILVTM